MPIWGQQSPDGFSTTLPKRLPMESSPLSAWFSQKRYLFRRLPSVPQHIFKLRLKSTCASTAFPAFPSSWNSSRRNFLMERLGQRGRRSSQDREEKNLRLRSAIQSEKREVTGSTPVPTTGKPQVERS